MEDENSVPSRPEWKYQMWICVLVLVQKLSTRLGQIATVWATAILLGGFVSGLSSYDFWVISAMTLASTLRLFGSTEEHKLNQKSHQKRRCVLLRWLFGGYKEFYMSYKTVIAGSLDLLMLLLQLASALVSLVLPVLRICQHNFGRSAAEVENQKHAMLLYYAMALVEALLFVLAKILLELPSPEYKKLIFEITYDRERLAIIFGMFDDYFVKVLTTARESVVEGLEMSLRWYISDMLVEAADSNRNKAVACILILDTLFQPGEWIKKKAHAVKRAKLLPFLFQHIDNTSDPKSREAAISLVISDPESREAAISLVINDPESREAAISLVASLMLNKTNAPEQYKFGPLVLLKALDSHPKAVDMLTGQPFLARHVAKYLENCLASGNKHEVGLGLDVVRRLPSEFLRCNTHNIVDVMAEQIKSPWIYKHRHLAGMMVLMMEKHGFRSRFDSVQASRAVELLIKGTRNSELEILVGLDAIGVISRKQKQKVGIANFFKDDNFIRCLPWMIKWVSSMDDESFHEIFEKRLDFATKESLIKHVESSRMRIRPDVIKFCRLLVRDSFFRRKIEQSPTLMQLLQPREEC